ncbi:sensor histidine kinase [Paractinoplanes maris]|uniref:sensor histidine kinase n=1 Tax=Paractinoplanes maris TaxID=1734446 RepID=UPI002022545F|nr:HAMP domain-containing sensor histidine kinase [Actinoplanes maris]
MLLILAGFLAVLGIANDPAHANRLLLVAACDSMLALVAFVVPWGRTGPNAAAWLGLPSFAVLGLSTWSFAGSATGTGPFLVLLYAWAALHFPRWILLAYVVPATLAYVVPLILTGQPPIVLGSAFILMPVALAVAMLIEAQARHLREDRERLARIEQWRSALMGTLAHDVRTPLSTVRMVLEELKGQAPPHIARMLDAALRQTARITRLAESLLDIQRIDSSGELKLDRQPHPARTLVQEMLTYVRVGPEVTVDVDEELTIYVDKQRFEQIVVNLVTNAARYGRPPIVIHVRPEGQFDRLEVRDHGPGIPDTLRSRLFSQFAVGGAEGVGLGLWIVRQLAVAHGGRAVAEARDPGVAMVVTFPRPVVIDPP